MHRFFGLTRSAIAAATMLAVLAGCQTSEVPKWPPTSDQFSSIVDHFQVTEIYGGYITSNLVVIYADHDGKPMRLLVDENNQLAAKEWDGAPLVGKKPLSELNFSSLEEYRQEVGEGRTECGSTTLDFDVSVSSSLSEHAHTEQFHRSSTGIT